MGFAAPFSSIREVIERTNAAETGCLVDTNFLVALTYEPHVFNEHTVAAYDTLADCKVPIYVGLPSRSELLDVQRRIIITEALMDMIAPGSKWKISKETTKTIRAQKTWVDTQATGDKLPILPDSRIKSCKEIFLPKNHSGQSGWLEICKHFLSDLRSTWAEAEKKLGLRYIGVREAEESKLFKKKLEWENLYRLSAKTCMASQDAMLLNLFDCSIFQILISTDYDLAYGNLAETNDKVVLVPDSLYEKKIKSLRFPEVNH
jgi:predicted nucleic acid-binding protein